MRALLGFLAAREFEVGLLLIHHLRKRGALAALGASGLVSPDDFRGSSHIMAMARSVLALSVVQDGPEPDRNGPRRLEVVKTNLCRYPEALGIAFEERGQAGSAVPWIKYGEAPKAYDEPTRTDECAEWLVELLAEAGQPLKPKQVVALAREAGFTRGVVFRAREEAGDLILDTEGRRHPGNRWTLAGAG